MNLWKRDVYEFTCQINTGDIDFKIMKYDFSGIYEFIGGSYLINPDDGNTERSRLYLESGFYLIMIFCNTATANFDIKVQYDELTNMVCNSPYTSTGGSTNGDAQGHFKQDLRHYFQIEIPYGNNTIILSNSETAKYQLKIYNDYWWVQYSLVSEDFGETITFLINHTNENSTTFILEIYADQGTGDFTIEILNPNEPTPKAGLSIYSLILFLPIIYLISRKRFLKKE